jgi:DNA-binding protein H-NS
VNAKSYYERMKDLQDAVRALRSMGDSFTAELRRIEIELLTLVGTAAAEELAREAAAPSERAAEPPADKPVKADKNGQQEIWDFGEGYNDDCI